MAQSRKRRGRSSPPARGRRSTGRDENPGQVGRRPSSPVFLLVVGVAWVACGVVAFLVMTASWKLVPAIFFVGVGLFWIRGAVTAAARQTRDS
jgi:Flp pilus assembly protein TadB